MVSNMRNNDKVSFIGRSIFIIFLLLLVISFVRLLFNSSLVTFTGFLDFLTTCPTITIPTSFYNSLSLAGIDWGIFNWFRNFLNFFTSSFSFIIFIITNLINALSIVFWFLKYILI
ncbi:MAG TPA: hypothetical protein DD621_05640 [Clostridiales bacterium]|nr:hypothetical protein [Clostridiales bacterium]